MKYSTSMKNRCQIKDLWKYSARVMLSVSSIKLNLGGDEGGHKVFYYGV